MDAKEIGEKLAKSEDLGYLVNRWLDECKYENIEDYRPRLQATLPEGAEILRMIRRPFGCVASFRGSFYKVTVTARGQIRVQKIVRAHVA